MKSEDGNCCLRTETLTACYSYPKNCLHACRPWQYLAIDLCGPLSKPKLGTSQILVMGDHFTIWYNAILVSNRSKVSIIHILDKCYFVSQKSFAVTIAVCLNPNSSRNVLRKVLRKHQGALQRSPASIARTRPCSWGHFIEAIVGTRISSLNTLIVNVRECTWLWRYYDTRLMISHEMGKRAYSMRVTSWRATTSQRTLTGHSTPRHLASTVYSLHASTPVNIWRSHTTGRRSVAIPTCQSGDSCTTTTICGLVESP